MSEGNHTPTVQNSAGKAWLPQLWADLRTSIVGSQQDFTEGSIGRAVFLLSVPMILEMVMQSVFGVVDVLFVGRLGAEAVAAVGLTDSLLTLVFAVGLGLAMAATAMVARRMGEKKPRAAASAAFQALALGVAVSIPLSLTGALGSRRWLGLLGAEQGTVETGWAYAAVVLGGSSTVLFLFLINAIFRGAGDAVLAMRSLWLANLLNIGLDPLLIFGWGPVPALGVTGAGIATTLARGVGVAYQLYLLFGSKGRLRLRSADCRFDLKVMRRLVRVGSTGVLQYLVGTASWLVVMRIIALFGSAALAGYTIAVRILIFALLPSWGLANAAATLVGQNLGAAKPERAERSVWLAAGANVLFLATVGLLLILFAEPLLRPFTTDPAVVAFGTDCVRIVSYSYVFFAVGMVAIQAFNGAGDTTTPTWINFFCYWVVELPLAYGLAQWAGLGARGVFWAVTVAQGAIAAVGVTLFRRGSWKRRSI